MPFMSKQQISRIDRDRAKYYEFYAGSDWGDKLNYDLCVNTSNASIKELASFIAKMVQ